MQPPFYLPQTSIYNEKAHNLKLFHIISRHCKLQHSHTQMIVKPQLAALWCTLIIISSTISAKDTRYLKRVSTIDKERNSIFTKQDFGKVNSISDDYYS